MVSFVFYIWILLTGMISAICAFSLIQPFWIIHPDNVHSFGLYVYCKSNQLGPSLDQPTGHICIPYGGHFNLVNIPSGAWQAAFLLFSTGCTTLVLSLILGMAGMFVTPKWMSRLSYLTTYTQTTAVLVMTAALVTYPVGMTSHFFRYYCGKEAEMFQSAQCSMGWSYMLAIMGTALSMFCPILWNLRDFKSDHADYRLNL